MAHGDTAERTALQLAIATLAFELGANPGDVLVLDDNLMPILDAPTGGESGGSPGIPLEDPGNVWEAETAVTEGYQIAATVDGELRVFQADAAGTTSDWPADFTDLSPSLALLGLTNDNDFNWVYLGIVGQISTAQLPPAAWFPIADPMGARLDVTSYDNPIGNGKIATIVFPEDGTAFAFAVEGDEFPRMVFGVDPTNIGIAMGDGTDDPTNQGMYYQGGGELGFNGFDGPIPTFANVLAASNDAGAHKITNLLDPEADQDAATKKYADDQALADGDVTTAKIADGAVTTVKIADGAVTTIKIDAFAITEGRLADNAVTTLKIADDVVTEAKILDGAVTTDKISDGVVTADKLATDAVTTDKIANGAVTGPEIGALAISTGKIQAGAVTANEISGSAVTAAKIAGDAVTTGKIADGSVFAQKTNLPTSNPGPGKVWNNDGTWSVGF